jgi:hypothetical protein
MSRRTVRFVVSYHIQGNLPGCLNKSILLFEKRPGKVRLPTQMETFIEAAELGRIVVHTVTSKII